MPFSQQHVRDVRAAPVDDKTLDVPDAAVGGMHVIATANLDLAGRHRVVGDGGRDCRSAGRAHAAQTVVGPREYLAAAVRAVAAAAGNELGLLRRAELLEL